MPKDPVPGDIVTCQGERRVVVDISPGHENEAPLAVLRPYGHPEGDLVVAEFNQLTMEGHVESVSGWVEDAPGEWRKL
jgi:hypothetical protein